MKLSQFLFTFFCSSFFLFSACATKTLGEKEELLKINSFTANLSGFSVNSHLIMGKSESILVDAQFTKSQARKVVEMIKESGTVLKMVYITHGHPDHYLGLEEIVKAFPGVKIIAKKEVVKTIIDTAQDKINYWGPIYKNDLFRKYIVPEIELSNEIVLEGVSIEIIDFGRGESAHDTSLYIPSQKILISGDTTYGKVHFWLAEDRAEHVLLNLKSLNQLNIQYIYTGHGESGSKNILLENIQYVNDFIKAVKDSYNVVEAKAMMLKKYQSYKLPIILELSLKAAFE